MIQNLDLKLNGTIPVNRKELIELISSWGRISNIQTNDRIKIDECKKLECYNLSNLDVSKIDDLSEIFSYSPYNGDFQKDKTLNVLSNRVLHLATKLLVVSKWDVSNCIDMNSMFYKSKFNNNSLNSWNISNVENMDYMFYLSNFNGNISNWDVSNIKKMKSMFDNCPFCNDISKWQFNIDVFCYEMFEDNKSFENKYNDGNKIPYHSKDFLRWLEENREKIREMNLPKEEILDFFSFDSNIEKDIK